MLKILLSLVFTIAVCVKSNNGALKKQPKYTYDDEIIAYIFNSTDPVYNIQTRPLAQVPIDLGISYRQLVSLDEKAGIMTSSFYLTVQWNDYRLAWSGAYPKKSNKWDNTTEIVLPATKIWLPDLAIINTAGTSLFVNINNSNLARVDINGNVYLIISMTGIQTRCRTDTYKYPFDTQNCSIQIGSWQLDKSRIDFFSNSSNIDTDNFQLNPLWLLNSVTAQEVKTTSRVKTKETKYQHEDIYFYVSISRRFLYNISAFVPCFILNIATLLAFFFNAIFFQIILCTSVFLSFGVYALKINGDLPVQSLYVSIYFIVAMFYTLIALIWFIVANYILTKNRIPRPLDFIAGKIQLYFEGIKFYLASKFHLKIGEKKDLLKESPRRSLGSVAFIETTYRSPIESVIQPSVLNNFRQGEQNKCKEEKCKEKENFSYSFRFLEEKKEKNNFENLDKNLKTLNYFVFFIVFLIMFILNLSSLISVSK